MPTTETNPISRVWDKFHTLRMTIANTISEKGPMIGMGDIDSIPDKTEPHDVQNLFRDSQTIAMQYESLYTDKKPPATEQAIASLLNVVDLAREAQIQGNNVVVLHQPDGHVERLTPDQINARILGYALFASNRGIINYTAIDEISDQFSPFWDRLMQDNSDLFYGVDSELVVRYPDHPTIVRARKVPSTEPLEFSDPLMQFAYNTRKFYDRIKKNNDIGESQIGRVRLIAARLHSQLALAVLRSADPIFNRAPGTTLPPDEELGSIILPPELQFLGREKITQVEARALSAAINQYLFAHEHPLQQI